MTGAGGERGVAGNGACHERHTDGRAAERAPLGHAEPDIDDELIALAARERRRPRQNSEIEVENYELGICDFARAAGVDEIRAVQAHRALVVIFFDHATSFRVVSEHLRSLTSEVTSRRATSVPSPAISITNPIATAVDTAAAIDNTNTVRGELDRA